MSKLSLTLALAASMGAAGVRAAGPANPGGAALPTESPPTVAHEAAARAEKRYNEMLDRMQASVEEIAGLYGNPTFLQVFTNDSARAEELKLRLRTDQGAARVTAELRDLEHKRDDLLSDIALKERESARLAARLVRQRAALDALAAAVDAARKAVEETAR
jgi:hypothetical protein